MSMTTPLKSAYRINYSVVGDKGVRVEAFREEKERDSWHNRLCEAKKKRETVIIRGILIDTKYIVEIYKDHG